MLGEMIGESMYCTCDRIFLRKDIKISVAIAQMVNDRIMEAARATRRIRSDMSLVCLLLVFT